MASICVALAANFTLKFMCVRSFQNRIQDSVYTLLVNRINASEWRQDFEIQRDKIIHRLTGSTFVFYGLKKNTADIKSTEGIDVLWLEESESLTKDEWKILEPTIRKASSKIVAVWNPNAITDWIHQNFVLGETADTVKREINWNENPYLSRTMLKVIYESYHIDPEDSLHTYGGAVQTSGNRAFIAYKWLAACIDAHLKLPGLAWYEGDSCVGFDIADGGGDALSTTLRRGRIVKKIAEWNEDSGKLFKSTGRAFNDAARSGASLCFDTCGLGSFIGEYAKNLIESTGQRIQVLPFNAGGEVLDKDQPYRKFASGSVLTNGQAFYNPKAQAWTLLSTLARNTYMAVKTGRKMPASEMISFDSKSIDRKLLQKALLELSTPLRLDRSGKALVETKELLRRRGIPSHNIADSIVLSVIARSNLDRESVGFFD